MEFSFEDKHAAVWLRLKAHAQERLDLARRKNDSDLDEIETARLRGEIRVWKEILVLDKDPPPVEAADS